MYFDWKYPIKNFGELLGGVLITLELTTLCFILSSCFGLILGIIRYTKCNKIIYSIATTYIELVRNTPFLVQLYFIYYGLSQYNIRISATCAAIFTLSANSAAYLAEIFRAGIQSVPKGQWEAGMTIQLTKGQMFFKIILPQALKNVFPSITNQCVIMLFATSICSIVDVRDLTQIISVLNSRSYRSLELFGTGMIMYYIIAVIIIYAFSRLNKHFFNYSTK